MTITLRNSDTMPRSAGIARLVGDHTVDEFHRGRRREEGVPIPAWIQDGGGVSTVEPGETVTVSQVLAPGKYGIADDETHGGEGEGKSLAELGAKGEFTVTGEATPTPSCPPSPPPLTADR